MDLDLDRIEKPGELFPWSFRPGFKAKKACSEPDLAAVHPPNLGKSPSASLPSVCSGRIGQGSDFVFAQVCP